MIDPRSSAPPALPRQEEVDRLCDEFERQFRAESKPRIEDFLVRVPAEVRTHALHELLALELELRLAAGLEIDADDYRKRFASDLEVIESEFRRARKDLLQMHTPSAATDALHVAKPQPTATSLFERETTSQNRAESAAEKPADLSHEPWAIGSRVDDFMIEQELGQGGFGVVVLAKDVVTDRHVALKALSPTRLGRDDAARFLDEVRKAAKLEHENIVRVYHVFSRHGVPTYVVMQYVQGADLTKVIREEGPLPYEAAARVICDVASALMHAHSRGIVHLDLKPSNILVSRNGTALLTDFGMALHHDERWDRAIGGTPAYMAPEQIQGRQEQLDGRTDLWAAGVVLYEMLTTRRPFTGGTGPNAAANLVREICHVEPKPPSQWNPLVPRGFDRICLKCLNKDISDRFASAAEFIEAVQTVKNQAGMEDEWSDNQNPTRRRLVAWGCMVIVVIAAALLLKMTGLMDWDDFRRWINTIRIRH